MVEWNEIDTVLLDMDGVLLDLRFDNWFWSEHVPAQYATKRGVCLEQAKAQVMPKLQSARGTLNWYCVDYWSEVLQLDIVQMKAVSAQHVSLRPLAIEFLEACRQATSSICLVTNAHRKTIRIKFEQTGLGEHFDEVICSHDFGAPKEHASFWHRARDEHGFATERALFIDDNLEVLRAARAFGIARLLAVRQPDSGQPQKDIAGFDAICSFAEIMPK